MLTANVVATLLPANASRRYLRIQLDYPSNGEGPIFITFDGSVPSLTNGIVLYPATGVSVIEFGNSFVPTGDVKAINLNGGVTGTINIIWA